MAKHATRVTPQKIHSVLRRAGHSKARWVPSDQGPAWSHWTDGYRVNASVDSINKTSEESPGFIRGEESRGLDLVIESD